MAGLAVIPALAQSIGPVGPAAPAQDEPGPINPFADIPEHASGEDADTLERLRELCGEGCMSEAALVNAAVKAPEGAVFEGTFIVDIAAVQPVPERFSLHSSSTPRPTCVVIEVKPDIMEELLQLFEWEILQEEASEDEIVVARTKRSRKPALSQDQLFFAGRQVVVQGTARLEKYPVSRFGSIDGHIRIRLKSAEQLVRVPQEMVRELVR